MQAVGEKQERHALHMVYIGPCNLKIHWQWRQGVGDLLWKDASVANSRMPIRLLGHNEWIQRSRTGFSLSPSMSPSVIPPPPSPLPLRMEQRSGEKLKLSLHEQYQHQISMQWFFFLPLVSQVQHGKHHHHHYHQQQQPCRWADRNMALIWAWKDAKDDAHIHERCSIYRVKENYIRKLRSALLKVPNFKNLLTGL